MVEARVTGLRSVEFSTTDLAGSVRFYVECWGLEVAAANPDATYLRGSGSEHHTLVLRPGPERKLLGVNLAAEDKESVDALSRRAQALGASADPPAAMGGPAGGYGFAFRDLDGREFTVTAGLEAHETETSSNDRPVKLSHVVLNSPRREDQSALFIDLLGFKLSDRTGYMDFVRCNNDHHSLAFTTIPTPTLNHCAFEVPSHDALMRASGRMKRSGFPVEWGVGRHGPGNNIFSYFIDPDGYVIEYTAEVEQVDDTYKTGMPQDWERPPEFFGDSWGFAAPASERFREATRG